MTWWLVLWGAGLGGAPGSASTPIVGGEAVVDDRFRSTVVVDFGVDLCSGTLIDERLVLTAAHCLRSSPPAELLTIKVGNTQNDPEITLPVEDYALHPEFCGSLLECSEDLMDFAYLVLAQPAPADAVVPQLPLAQPTWDAMIFGGANVVLAGFGNDDQLQWGQKRVVETTIRRFTETGLEFFAGGDGKDSCQRDSGGPAYARGPEGQLVLVGVVSRGIGCGDGGYLGATPAALCWIGQQEGLDAWTAACEVDTTPPSAESGGCCSIAGLGRGSGPYGGGRAGRRDLLGLLALVALVALVRRHRRDGMA